MSGKSEQLLFTAAGWTPAGGEALFQELRRSSKRQDSLPAGSWCSERWVDRQEARKIRAVDDKYLGIFFVFENLQEKVKGRAE